jgi:hypothetical protein
VVATGWSVTLWERRGGGSARYRKGRGAGRRGERGRQREKGRWGREDERRKKMMLTNGTRMPLRGE